jgi:hypothetical protein
MIHREGTAGTRRSGNGFDYGYSFPKTKVNDRFLHLYQRSFPFEKLPIVGTLICAGAGKLRGSMFSSANRASHTPTLPDSDFDCDPTSSPESAHGTCRGGVCLQIEPASTAEDSDLGSWLSQVLPRHQRIPRGPVVFRPFTSIEATEFCVKTLSALMHRRTLPRSHTRSTSDAPLERSNQ